jgi:hypothetical protein
MDPVPSSRMDSSQYPLSQVTEIRYIKRCKENEQIPIALGGFACPSAYLCALFKRSAPM